MDPNDALREALVRAVARARDAWPGMEVPDERFGEELAARVEASEPEAVERLNVVEIYLAVACAAGDARAIAELEKRYLADTRAALSRLGFAPSVVDETLQVLREQLLVARPNGPPRILEFGGKGQLRGWLRVVASRIAYRSARTDKRSSPLEGFVAREEGAAGDLELEMLKNTYGATFEAAFAEALGALPRKDRLLLKQRFTHQMTVIELGAQHGVHASTISRWVDAARERLIAEIREAMVRRLHVAESEISSILRLIRSEVDISLSSVRSTE